MPTCARACQVLEDPSSAGYHAVLSQIYQAYEQRLTKAAKEELRRKGYLPPGAAATAAVLAVYGCHVAAAAD